MERNHDIQMLNFYMDLNALYFIFQDFNVILIKVYMYKYNTVIV